MVVENDQSFQCGLYTVYDRIAQQYGPIYEAVNEAVAIRAYVVMMKDTEFPDDYELWKVGYHNKVTGKLEMEKPKVVEVSVGAFMKRSLDHEQS